MEIVTLCFLRKEAHICLAPKKHKIGAGKRNGYGGRVQVGETVRQAAVRELQEEACVTALPEDLEQVAVITLYHRNQATYECHIFFVYDWDGEPRETAEMGPPKMYHEDNIPKKHMLPGDAHWLPLLLAGNKLRGRLHHSDDFKSVQRFMWEEAEFPA